MSRPISDAVRREAIEYAGCMATYIENAGPAHPGLSGDGGPFSDDAINLAFSARLIVIDECGPEHRWPEVQARLIEGWTP